MSADLAEGQSVRRAAVRHAMDVLRLCILGRPRDGVLGFASSGTAGRGPLVVHVSRWKALPPALAGILRPAPEPASVAEWVLTREAGGWAVRPSGAPGGEPSYFTAAIPADDQNAAFDWASDVTPEVDRKAVHYSGPTPT